MAVRAFAGNSNSQIAMRGSQIGAFLNGAHTIVALVNVTTYNDPTPFVAIWDTGARLTDWGSRPNERTQYATAAGNSNGLVDTGDTGGDWFMHVVTKTSGTTTPRFHWKNIQTGGAWGHANSDSTKANIATAVDTIRFGVSDDRYLNGMMALAAIYNYALTDAQVESLTATSSTMNFFNVSSSGADPVGLWQFNQTSLTTIDDLSGNNGDEISRVGTTIVTGDDPPGWTFVGAGGTVLAPNIGHLSRPGNIALSVVDAYEEVGGNIFTKTGLGIIGP